LAALILSNACQRFKKRDVLRDECSSKSCKRGEKMKRVLTTLLITGALASFGTGLANADDKIHDRKENQQDRIANGVKNGSLTPGETANLEKREANLNKEIRNDRKANGGNLTNKEKKQINRQQNNLSKSIYRDKHNASHQ
jgi:hypothetical protein